MQAVGWAEAAKHVETPMYVSTTELQTVADEIWAELQHQCAIPKAANIEVFMDVTQMGVLAFTRRTFLLMDDMWKPSIMSDYSGVDIEIHFNPNVPNGWYNGDDCNTGWRYDLRTVMRHEMLHGAGLSSSIRRSATATTVGYELGGQCYPTFYDTRLVSGGVPIVDGCNYVGGPGTVYMAGRSVYVPREYQAGSSYSHHDEDGLFRWQLAPKQCSTYNDAEFDMLEGLDYDCGYGRYLLSSGQKLNANCALLLLLVLNVWSRSLRVSCLWSSIIASTACWYLHCM